MGYRTVIDMTGREVKIPVLPQRIISLVPSQTELLFHLGLSTEVIGITKFCIHPLEWYKNKSRMGGTKNLNFRKISALKPDLIIANKEENTKEQIEILATEFPVWVSDIKTIHDAATMINQIGILVNKEEHATTISSRIQNDFANLPSIPKQRVAYLIWKKPWMCAGGDTFINNIIEQMGWVNVFADKMRYPEINLSAIINNNTDRVLLSSEPYPFKERDLQELQTLLPDIKIQLIDGEMFSWYGSHLLLTCNYLRSIV